jgi:mediator of RNA polymerase II transcription subunit 5
MTLKNICNSLSRRPQALDVILIFRNPKQVLQPLCALLDSWHWDEDQGENQPVYDEFGSILLLVLAFKYRFDLRPADLGISSNDSFVLRLLERGSCSQKLDALDEKQNKNLGSWIAALFIAEGISEETMSACSPQEFYLLVATLFSQSLEACETGKLEFDTLKGGFECKLIGLDCWKDTDMSRSARAVSVTVPYLRADVVGEPYLGNGTRPLNTVEGATFPS